MTFKDALHILSTNLILKIVLPDWARYLSKKKRDTDLAFTELKVCHSKSYDCICVVYTMYDEQQYMLEMVETRRNGDKVEQRHDLFSGLLDASQDENGSEAALNDDELMGRYSMSGSCVILGKLLICPPRKHVHISFCWTRGAIFPFILRCCPNTVHRRRQHIHYASHLPCWLFILMSKSVCINTSKALCPA